MLLRHSKPLVNPSFGGLCFKVKSDRSGSETLHTADLTIAVCFSAFDKTQRNSHFFDFLSLNGASSATSPCGKDFRF